MIESPSRRRNASLDWINRYLIKVVLAQLVERSLQTPEVRGSNPVMANFYIEHLFTENCKEKTKIKKKRPGMAHF